MMTDNELEVVYKANISESHYAGLRGVFDAGYALGAGLSAQVASVTDQSTASTVTDATVAPVVNSTITTV
jgi:hypothetical protein